MWRKVPSVAAARKKKVQKKVEGYSIKYHLTAHMTEA